MDFIKKKIMRIRKEQRTRMGQGHREGKDNRIGTIMGKGQVYDRDRMGKGRAIVHGWDRYIGGEGR